MNLKSVLIPITMCFFAAVASQCSGGLITNGDFETGDSSSWFTSQAGGSTLAVLANPGDASLGPSPTNDFYAFAGNQSGPSQNIFTQSFVVPNSSLSQAVLSFDYAYENFSSSFIIPNPDSLNHNGNFSNQQFRVEVLKGAAAFDSVDPADIVFTAVQTSPGDLNPQPWTSFSQDISAELSPFLGQTLQIRFAQADNNGPFDFGFDNVSLVVSTSNATVPEPSSLAIFGLGAIGMVGMRACDVSKSNSHS